MQSLVLQYQRLHQSLLSKIRSKNFNAMRSHFKVEICFLHKLVEEFFSVSPKH